MGTNAFALRPLRLKVSEGLYVDYVCLSFSNFISETLAPVST